MWNCRRYLWIARHPRQHHSRLNRSPGSSRAGSKSTPVELETWNLPELNTDKPPDNVGELWCTGQAWSESLVGGNESGKQEDGGWLLLRSSTLRRHSGGEIASHQPSPFESAKRVSFDAQLKFNWGTDFESEEVKNEIVASLEIFSDNFKGYWT